MSQPELYDVTIIGAGPVGLYTAFYSGLRAMKTKLIDAEPAVGGKVRYFYPEKIIRDIGGSPEIKGHELIANLKKQAETFQPTIVCNEKIVHLEQLPGGNFILESESGTQHFSKTVIIACGSGTYEVNPLEAENTANFPSQLHYSLTDLEAFRDKKIVISGGGNAALDAALTLLPVAKSVQVIYRGDDLKGHEETVRELKRSNATIHVAHNIERLSGEADKLRQVMIRCKETGRTQTVPCDAIFVGHGVKVELGAMRNWGFDTEEWGITVDSLMQTSIPGIFACGDVACYPRKIRIILAGLHEGPIAVNSAVKFLEPQAADEAMVSTHHESFE
ncbi:NAD(P)/FAD-dependent oxidoreductase [Listeria costaricensis]|uniref:NAD(P)/FAD-dependent oxidoreductase n=1 Tax=Listeria costaricensis TaxID=2026604 RepID=UPI000C088EEC|nr:NAD(P)/FAD-dependent oxidoreductase [Listeria costaricensis]